MSKPPYRQPRMNTLQVTVTKKSIEAQDIASFELTLPEGALPRFSAGSHIDVHAPNGSIRQYSLCNDPSESHRYQIAVLRDPGSRGGSVAMHDLVHEGDRLTISEPRNHFPLVPGQRFLLFAGGIGITPILCMAERLAAIGAEFELHYCARSPERTAFRERIASASFAGRVHFHFDTDPASHLDCAAALGGPQPGAHIYTCGPSGFIDFVTGTARANGWPDAQIHVEYFGAAVPLVTDGDAGFEVELASTGARYQVGPEESVVAALARHGIEIEVSCEQGVCGTCITRVLKGDVDHRDSYFTDDEKAANDQFTPCCSRARSSCLVLDL